MKYIDIHTHGGLGVNFNTSEHNEIKMLLKELYKRNIVAICPTLVGDSIQNLKKRFELFRKLKNNQEPNESKIIGLHLEGTFLNPNKPGIQDKSVFMEPTVENFKLLALEYLDIIKIVTFAPELDKDNSFAEFLNKNNIKAQAGHTQANNKGGAIATTHHFNAMPNISHRGENLALDCLFDDDIYSEIICDTIHVSKNMLRLFFAVKNPSKIIMISDSLPAAHCNSEIIFCGKKINKNGKDENGTLAGSVMFLDEIAKLAVKKGIISKQNIEKYTYYNQIEYLNLNEREF